MNKIRVIDLLNKIANGEEVPKTIKYNNEIFTLRDEKDDYANDNNWFTDRYSFLELNDEVEIIEDTPKEEIQVLSRWYQPKENKKIEKLNLEFDDGFIKEHFIGSSVSYLSEYTTLKMLYEKQCEIIDKINGE